MEEVLLPGKFFKTILIGSKLVKLLISLPDGFPIVLLLFLL